MNIGFARLMRCSVWLLTLALIGLICLPLRAHGQSKGPVTPTEVKRTTDAFLGRWVLTGTDTEPSPQAPARFNLTIDCKPAALGAAVNCSFVGRLPGVGRVEASSVIGYSPDEQVVRWMEISSI